MLPCRNHADRSAETLCTRCGDLVCGLCAIRLEGQDHCPACAPRVRADLVRFGPYIAWEDRARLGFVQAAWQTIRSIFVNPREFAERVPLEGGLAEPLLFGMMMRSISVVWTAILVATAYAAIGFALDQPELFMNAGIQLVSMVWNIPVAGALLFMLAGLIHLGVVLVANGGKGFEATFRIYCYGRAADVMDVVPVLGPFASLGYRIWIYTIGFQRFLGGSAVKALFCATIPIQVWLFFTLFLTGVVIVVMLLFL